MWGSLTYKQWYAPTVTLSYFHPWHQLKPPVFTKNCLPKSSIFSTLSKMLEIFHSKTPNWLEFEKTSYAPIFMAFVTEGPLFLALHAHIWEECCSLKHGLQKLENFVFLKQNRAIWWILLGANLTSRWWKQNFSSTGSTDPFVHYGWTSLEGRADTQAIIPPVKHGRGYILQPPSVWSCATWLSKQMPSVPEAVQAEAC